MIARITFTISLLTILFAVIPSHAASLAEMSHYDQMLALRAAYQQNFGAEKSVFGGLAAKQSIAKRLNSLSPE